MVIDYEIKSAESLVVNEILRVNSSIIVNHEAFGVAKVSLNTVVFLWLLALNNWRLFHGWIWQSLLTLAKEDCCQDHLLWSSISGFTNNAFLTFKSNLIKVECWTPLASFLLKRHIENLVLLTKSSKIYFFSWEK